METPIVHCEDVQQSYGIKLMSLSANGERSRLIVSDLWFWSLWSFGSGGFD